MIASRHLPLHSPLLGPALGLCLLIVLAIGCGGPTAQISGHAKFADGSPIKGGVRKVIFAPADDSTAEVKKAASAEIGDDGSFALYTRKAGDGVYKGKYAVTFMVLDNPRDGGLLVPEKYTFAETTPFKIEVTGDRSDLVFELEKP